MSVEKITDERSGQRGRENYEDFAAFFHDHSEKLLRAMYLISGDRYEAEEIAQEAFARLYERWARVSRMRSPEGYLFRTARNVHRRRLRRLATEARRLVAKSERLGDAEAAEIRQDVLAVLRSMPSSQRTALVLVEWVGLTTEEVANALGIAPSSVRARLHRARATFRERLGEGYE